MKDIGLKFWGDRQNVVVLMLIGPGKSYRGAFRLQVIFIGHNWQEHPFPFSTRN
jgi:hypothetical protein